MTTSSPSADPAAQDLTPSPAAMTRRRAMGAAGIATVGAVGLSACGASAPTNDAATTPTAAATPVDVAAAADIPVGSGIKVDSDGVQAVVGQPTDGTFTAFSPVCPHEGCLVNPANQQYVCPCHNSVFDMATGQVKGGPAPTGLTEYPVTVRDGRVIVG